jgi:hypothetical protein
MRSAPLLASLLVLGLLGSGCATTGKAAGSAGPVAWEVVDVGRINSVDGSTRTRWSYTMVLKNTGATPIQFEQIDRSSRAPTLEVGGLNRVDFQYRLEPNGELRYHTTHSWGWPSMAGTRFGGVEQLGALTIEDRFVGKDSQGQAVAVPVRAILDRTFGRASRQPPRPEPPPLPAKALQAQDLGGLAGRWEGYARLGAFMVPIETVVHEDGSAEFGENDPVTYRSRGRLTVRNGKAWLTGRESAELAYHEDAGRRMLGGSLTYPTTAGGSNRLPVWLERVGPVPSATTAATPAAEPAPARGSSLPPAIQKSFDTWRTDRMYQPFKAFAVDRRAGTWGGSWSLGSAESAAARAMEECRKRGTACELHAVNDTVLASLSPERRALVMLGGMYLHYKGTLTIEEEGRVERSPATVTLRRGLDEIIGSVSSDEPGPPRGITGGAALANPFSVWISQIEPCHRQWAGVVTLGEDGKTVDLSYAGSGCDGLPMRATFTGARP